MDWKKRFRQILSPPGWLLVLLCLVCAAALTAVFLNGWEQMPFAYICYVLSFYTLCAVCFFCICVLPGQYRLLRQRFLSTTLGRRLAAEPDLRTRLSMYLSLGSNLLLTGINVLLWHLDKSWWYLVLAAYYCILSVLWALLADHIRRHSPGAAVLREWKRARACAWILLSINLVLSGAVLMMLYQNKGFHYDGILIYVMALLTFYNTTAAFADTIKYRKLGSPILSTAKIVSLSAALISMLNLESAMFAQFGATMPAADQHLFIILTGAGVSVTVITFSLICIRKATNQIRRDKNGK